jgi:hypothetical protein
MRSVYWRATLCGVALLGVACDDDGVGIGDGQGGAGKLMAPASVDRFSVDVRASGSFRPGQPIQITVTGAANLNTGNTTVQLLLPEVAAAERGGWSRMEYGPGGAVQPALVARQAMSRGQSLTRTANITIPRPGYYQVIASVIQSEESPSDERPEQLVQNVAHDEIWLWVSENGGRVTESFEPNRIPESMHRVPGPLTPMTQAPPTARTDAAEGPRTQRAAATRPRTNHAPISGWVDIHAMYMNQDIKNPDNTYGALRPIPNARYEFIIYNRLGTQVQIAPGETDTEGLAFMQCYSDANGWGRYKLKVYLDNNRVTMAEQLVLETQIRDFATTCGTVANEQALTGNLPKERAHVFQNLDRAIRNGDAFFGRQRGDITVAMSSTHSYSTYEWSTAARRLIIATNPGTGFAGQIWGTYGAFVQAHEYGHAYHNDVLGGVERYYYNPYPTPVCPTVHNMQDATNLQCALAEGFADYYAVVALPGGTGGIQNDLEVAVYSPGATNLFGKAAGANGSIIEGAVASFFYDITDPANETHDQTQYPGSYVADIVRSCQVYAGAWRLNNGVDDIAYCFLGTVYDKERFTTRSPAPTGVSETATEPEIYDTRFWKIRKNYMRNLFGIVT